MKFKGIWDGETSYAVGDVVQFDVNKRVYHLQKPAPAGTEPIDTLYWGQLNQEASEIIVMLIDFLLGMKNSIPTNIDDEGIILKGSEDAEYLVTVDDSGETPELVATLIEPEEPEEGSDT